MTHPAKIAGEGCAGGASQQGAPLWRLWSILDETCLKPQFRGVHPKGVEPRDAVTPAPWGARRRPPGLEFESVAASG